MASTRSIFLFALLCACAVDLAATQPAAAEAAGMDGDEDPGAPFADDVGDDGFLESSPQWREIVGRIRKSIDRPGLLRARRWGNIANGALLAATGPISLTINLLGLKLSNVVLSLYVSVFGGVLTSVEMGLAPVAPWVRENMVYLTTATGRTALLAFLGGLTWPLGKLGLVPALLTCMNAIFNANFQRLLAFVEEGGAEKQPPPPGLSPGEGGMGGSAAADDDDAELAAAQARAAAAAAAAQAEEEAQARAALQAQMEAEAAAAREAELRRKQQQSAQQAESQQTIPEDELS